MQSKTRKRKIIKKVIIYGINLKFFVFLFTELQHHLGSNENNNERKRDISNSPPAARRNTRRK